MSGFQAERAVTAQKQHQCLDCGRAIVPGEKYVKSAGNFYGDFWHWKSCAHCDAFRIIVSKMDPESAYDDDGFNLKEWVSEYGISAAEMSVHKEHALSMYRWSRWMDGRWADTQGRLREVPVMA